MHTHPYMICRHGIAFGSYCTAQAAIEAIADLHDAGEPLRDFSVYDVRPECAYPWMTIERESNGYCATQHAHNPNRFV
jgi:hypothetical protein